MSNPCLHGINDEEQMDGDDTCDQCRQAWANVEAEGWNGADISDAPYIPSWLLNHECEEINESHHHQTDQL